MVEHAQDVISVLVWALSTLGAVFVAVLAALVALARFWLLGQFANVKSVAAAAIEQLKTDLAEFKREDEQRRREANEKIDALFELHRRIEDVMRGELRTLERNVVDVRERVLVIESKCALFHAHADDRRDPLKIRGG